MTSAAAARGERRRGPSRRGATRRARRAVWPALFSLTVLAVLFYGVFPTNTWLDQRGELDRTRAELGSLEAANAELAQQVALLGTDAEIERIARADYGLVLPGEEAYVVLPPEPAPATLPAHWPFTALFDDVRR